MFTKIGNIFFYFFLVVDNKYYPLNNIQLILFLSDHCQHCFTPLIYRITNESMFLFDQFLVLKSNLFLIDL